MKFRSSAKEAVIVVRPQEVYVEAGLRRVTRPLRAEFHDHLFDSVEAQKRYQWTDEERELVERAIMNNPRFMAPNAVLGFPRFYLHELETQPQAPATRPATSGLLCMWSVPDPSGDTVLCRQPVAEGQDYCEEHLNVLRGHVAKVTAGGDD